MTDATVTLDAPLVGVSQEQSEAAARVVAGMCPDDARAVLSALGLLRNGRIAPPPASHGVALLDTSPQVGGRL